MTEKQPKQGDQVTIIASPHKGKHGTLGAYRRTEQWERDANGYLNLMAKGWDIQIDGGERVTYEHEDGFALEGEPGWKD